MQNPLNSVLILFENLFAGADEKLLDVMLSDDSKDVYLTAPDIIFTLYKKALMVDSELNNEASQAGFLLNRIFIFPSPAWEITLYHKDYALTNEHWMKRTMILAIPQKHRKNMTTLFF